MGLVMFGLLIIFGSFWSYFVYKTQMKEIDNYTRTTFHGSLIEPVKEEEPIVEEVEVVKPKTKRTTKTKEKDLNTKYDELKKLKELLDSNILTQEEFDKEKNKILKD